MRIFYWKGPTILFLLNKTWLRILYWKWQTMFHIKYKPMNIWFFWTFTPAKVVIYQNIHLNDLAGFLNHAPTCKRRNFPPFNQVWSLGFLCAVAAIYDDFVRIFRLIFWNGIEPLATFTEYRIYIFSKNGLICEGEHRKRKTSGLIPGFHWQNGERLFNWVTLLLQRHRLFRKHFNYSLSSSFFFFLN